MKMKFTNKTIKLFSAFLMVFVLLISFYSYKLHLLAIEENKLFEQRCLTVNPPLIGYKNSFLEVARDLKDPQANSEIDIKDSFDQYISGMRDYVERENKWLKMQNAYVDRWDFELLEPTTVKEAANYQLKKYAASRDETEAKLEMFDKNDPKSDIKLADAQDRMSQYSELYTDSMDKLSKSNDLRIWLINLPLPEGCNDLNTIIPNTGGALDEEDPSTPLPSSVSSDLTS